MIHGMRFTGHNSKVRPAWLSRSSGTWCAWVSWMRPNVGQPKSTWTKTKQKWKFGTHEFIQKTSDNICIFVDGCFWSLGLGEPNLWVYQADMIVLHPSHKPHQRGGLRRLPTPLVQEAQKALHTNGRPWVGRLGRLGSHTVWCIWTTSFGISQRQAAIRLFVQRFLNLKRNVLTADSPNGLLILAFPWFSMSCVPPFTDQSRSWHVLCLSNAALELLSVNACHTGLHPAFHDSLVWRTSRITNTKMF